MKSKLFLAIALILSLSCNSARAGEWDIDFDLKVRTWEDVVQHIPIGTDVLIGLLGVNADRDCFERVISCGVGFVTSTAIVLPLKHLIKEERPSHTNHKSFPSGHSATSFLGAELVRMHYGWAWGAGAYAVATTVAIARVAHQWHWWWDTLAGAVIGIGSAHVAELVCSPIRNFVDPKHRINLSSYYDPYSGALCANIRVTF